MRGAARAAALAATLAACTPPPGVILVPPQPPNVGDAAAEARAYHDSGAYLRVLAQVDEAAARWIEYRAPLVPRPALVLDVDETALSNWAVLTRDQFGRFAPGPCIPESDAPCGWTAWDMLGQDPPIGPTLDLFRRARARGVTVFFITGRPESQRAATERNLRAAGYDGYARLSLVPPGLHFASAAQFKTPVRAQIAREGWTIIANVGDQPSDLLGGYSERTFLLPDPFYRVP